jgi:hypothetical protein
MGRLTILMLRSRYPALCPEATRSTAEQFDIDYYFADEIVLRRSLSEKDGPVLHDFDPAFWTILVNGCPATRGILANIESQPNAVKVDPEKRIISFKVRDDMSPMLTMEKS